MENPAIFAKEVYHLTDNDSKEKRMEKINKNLEGTDFRIIPEKSNRDIGYFQNDKDEIVNISARGTDIENKKKIKQDLYSDLLFAVGQEAHDKEHKKKAKQIQKLVRETPSKFSINLIGHSIGASHILHAVKTKGDVRKRVNKIFTFNPATSPFTPKPTKKVRDELEGKIENFRTSKDIVSSNYGSLLGPVKTFKSKTRTFKHKVIPEPLQPVFATLDQMQEHSINSFV